MPRFTIEFTTESEMREFLDARSEGSIEKPSIQIANLMGTPVALGLAVDQDNPDMLTIEVHPRTTFEQPDFVGEKLVHGASFQIS